MNRRFFCAILQLHHDMCHDKPHAAASCYTDKARNHKAVIQDVLADTGSTGTVEANAGQIGRISRQEEVTIAGRDEGHNHHRVHTYRQSQRHNDGDSCSLRVNQFGRQEGDDCICPGISRYGSAQAFLEESHMSTKVSAGHPGNTIYGYESNDTGTEYLTVAYVLSLDVTNSITI